MAENADSILNSIKKFLSISPDDPSFDQDVTLHINSVFSTLQQLGVGPSTGFFIEDAAKTWTDYLGTNPELNAVKSYMYLRVRLLFDPPTTSFALDSYKNQVLELEWRINVAVENTGIQAETPVVVSPEQIAAAVEGYLTEHPVSADEPLLEEHLTDPTPHPVYDELADGRFVDKIRNGMA